MKIENRLLDLAVWKQSPDALDSSSFTWSGGGNLIGVV